ncbi:Uncharacterized protein PECH_008857 [Penicillium ucsense]|uniref:Uncharacterized protein n=1 Tax=Penicillium ucsense TaxID=2839758 RepID=A0A8J8W354_9EURO|nr:Uncharacterized protein PECM_008431 [Penicillium ucsense]KAF7733853.1 Uncharacterized protein PECH_008857 [Penicillium ucsense]
MHHHDPELVMRHTIVQREVIPPLRLPLLVPSATTLPGTGMPSLVVRAPDSATTTDAKKCGGSTCETATSNMTTTVLPIVLGAGVPVICAIVVLVFLHRRHTKKLLHEDAMDKHKSLDFGMDDVTPKKPRKLPNGLEAEMSQPSHSKGLSLDVSPYLMPPVLNGSRDSLHSLARSIDDDKYRPAVFGAQDNGSVRSFPRNRGDDASSLAPSTRQAYAGNEDPNSGLLRNAQSMSRTSPPRYDSPPADQLPQRPPAAHHPNQSGPPSRVTSPTSDAGKAHDRAVSPQEPAFPRQNNINSMAELHFEVEPPIIQHTQATPQEEHPGYPLSDHGEPGPHGQAVTTMPTPRISFPASDITVSDYGDDRKPDLTINVHAAEDHRPHMTDGQSPHLDQSPSDAHQEAQRKLDVEFDQNNRPDTRRLTLGVRPLPPEDPADNPEQRANRIRSFYKEYFDDSKRETTYYQDFGPEFYEDGGYIYDPSTGDYYDSTAPPALPYAEPVTRRAMTPPPRAPPRFQGQARHMATNSAGHNNYGGPGPRAFSSASGRMPGARGAPQRPPPAPTPLQMLPTPHMLKDDSIFMAADFAPAYGVRDRRDGRPETPTGGMMPYSPTIRAHTPLASAFDDLSVMPSPHALRKSGTYTSLDFAPPPRFKNSDGGSDAGSIRSNRTGISNHHMNNIRNGNYRVSRLPTDMVGTRDDMITSLRPTMDLTR